MDSIMKNRNISVLLLEDNPAQYALLSAYLEKENFKVVHADCIKTFKKLIETENIDLVLLDLNLPDGDGLQLVKNIKSVHRLPVIIITSRDTIEDRVIGLETGADDYICKPYHPRELIIRVYKLLNSETESGADAPDKIMLNDYLFDEEAHCFLDKGRNCIKLTPGEYTIMTSLLKNNGRILSRSQLIDTAFSRIEYPTDRSIDVLISRLRKKFPLATGEPEIIETVKGFGYRINRNVLK